MPMYEYVCEDCGGRHEALRSFSERDHAARCKGCGGEAKRALSAFAVSRGGASAASASSAASCSPGG